MRWEARVRPLAAAAAWEPSVTAKTLLARLPEDTARSFSESVYYCPNPHCEVAYFDRWGTAVSRSDLKSTAYPKDPGAPICSCFGITAEKIRRDAGAGRKDRVREILTKAESEAARCETESPSGESCVAEIRRLFMKHLPAK